MILGSAPLVDPEISGDLDEFADHGGQFQTDRCVGKCRHSDYGSKGPRIQRLKALVSLGLKECSTRLRDCPSFRG